MDIEFLGHFGFLVKTDGLQILVDPWITPSSIDYPIIESITRQQASITSLNPRPFRHREQIAPDIILLSNYGPTSAPKSDIDYWLAKTTEKVLIVGPGMDSGLKEKFLGEFSCRFPLHTFIDAVEDFKINIKGVEIHALTHTIPNKLSFFLRHGQKSFLHLSETMVSRSFHDSRLDPLWHRFKSLEPTFFAVASGISNLKARDQHDWSPLVVDDTKLSPADAARLSTILNPRIAAIMGSDSSSIFRHRAEYSLPIEQVESWFRWALGHLNEKIEIPILRPGVTIRLSTERSYQVLLKPVENNMHED